MQGKLSFFEEEMDDNKENKFTPSVSPMESIENSGSVNRFFQYNDHFEFPVSSSCEPTIENGGMQVDALQSFENIGQTEQLNFRTLRYPTPKKASTEEEQSIKSFLKF